MLLSEHFGIENLPELVGGTLGVVAVGLITILGIRKLFEGVLGNDK